MSKCSWSKEEIEKKIGELASIQPWWHDIELPYGVHTRGIAKANWEPNHNVPKWQRIAALLLENLNRVIDLGCNEGYFCLKLSQIGIKEIIGVDANRDRIEKARFVMDLSRVKNIRLIQEDIYNLEKLQLGHFDLALCLGLLHRVPDPYGLLAIVTQLADSIILEWSEIISDEPIMRFWGGGFKTYDVHNSGYWRPSRACVQQILERFGFRHFYDLETISNRAIMLASKRSLNLPTSELQSEPKTKPDSVTPKAWSLVIKSRRRLATILTNLSIRIDGASGSKL